MSGFIRAEDAARIAGCTVEQLDLWRRTVLPGLPRRRAEQADDQFRPDEVVAVAIGVWLNGLKTPVAEQFVARLFADFPEGDDWGVLRKGGRKVFLLERNELAAARGRLRPTEVIFETAAAFQAIREVRP